MRLINPLPLIAALSFFMAVHATPAHAQITNIPVTNNSFETPDAADSGVSGTVTGWTVSNGGIFDPGNGQYAGATGNTIPLPGTAQGFQLLYLNANGIATSNAITTTTQSSLYTLTVALGNKLNDTPGTALIELLADGVLVSSTSAIGNAIPEGTFTDYTTSYTAATSGQNLTVRLQNQNSGQTNFDNVRLTSGIAAVPEPGTVALLSTSLLPLGAFLLRKRRSHKL